MDESSCIESFCDNVGCDHELLHQEFPISFTTFPWQVLTTGDSQVLDSTVESFLSHGEDNILSAIQFLQSVLLSDFPPEVFVQRPALIQAVYSCMREEEESVSRIRTQACECLLTLTKRLTTRVKQFTHTHLKPLTNQDPTCTDYSIEDDRDEFILLRHHQQTVPDFCIQTIGLSSPLLASTSLALSSSCLELLLALLDLLRLCVEPGLLWEVNLRESEQVAAGIKKLLVNLSHLKISSSLRIQYANSKTEAKKQVVNAQTFALLMCQVLEKFVPLEFSTVVLNSEMLDGIMSVLFDGGFYLSHKTQHLTFLKYLEKADLSLFNNIKSILLVCDSFQASHEFLQVTQFDLGELLRLAECTIPSLFIHQSKKVIEKLIRDLAMKTATPDVSKDLLNHSRDILLKILNYSDEHVRLCGYKSVYEVVEESIGISQAANTCFELSRNVAILLHSDIITFILYSGLTDHNTKVETLSKNILLTLLHGKLLMTDHVWLLAKECWRHCLPHFVSVCDYSTSLGQSVSKLPVAVFGEDKLLQNIEVLRYHLQGMFLCKMETRIQFLSRVIQKIALACGSSVLDPGIFSYTLHHDLCIIKHPINILHTIDMTSERSQLPKVLELLTSEVESFGLRKVAWNQLSLLLQDPQLHQPFLNLCSVTFLKQCFVSMIKKEEHVRWTVDMIPGAVESIRLLATHSLKIKETLRNDAELLLSLVQGALLFYHDEQIRIQCCCLLAILVFSDIIKYKKLHENGRSFISVPVLIMKNVHFPFICETQNWIQEATFCFKMRTVQELLRDDSDRTFSFLRCVWLCVQYGGIERLLTNQDIIPSRYGENKDEGFNEDPLFSPLLKMKDTDIEILKFSVHKHVGESLLKNIENGTSHQEVKVNSELLRFFILHMGLCSCGEGELFSSDQWSRTFQRFLTSSPNSAVDKQLLIHILKSLSGYFKVHHQLVKEGNSSCVPSLLLLVMNEFTSRDSSIQQLLQTTGSVNWQPGDSNRHLLQSLRLFHWQIVLIINIVRSAASHLLDDLEKGQLVRRMGESLSSCLVSFLHARSSYQHHNLVVLVKSLECLVHMTAVVDSLGQQSAPLVTSCIRLIKMYHLGRGQACNSYVGGAVTLYSAIIIHQIISHCGSELEEVVHCLSQNDDIENATWDWLVSLWVQKDVALSSCGLSIAAALTEKASSSISFQDSLQGVSGGIWGVALSNLLSNKTCLLRNSAAQLIIALSKVCQSERSWTCPVVVDTLTGETDGGLAAVMVLLEHCDFYSHIYSTMSHLSLKECPNITGRSQIPETSLDDYRDWDRSITQLSSFMDDSDDGDIGSKADNHNSIGSISLEFYETLLRVLTNIVLMKPKKVIPLLHSHGILDLIIRQLRIIVINIRSSVLHMYTTESALVLIESVLKYDPKSAPSIAKDTSLIHLALVVFSLGIKRNEMNIVCLEVLNGLVCSSDWGAIRVLQWITVAPALILHPLLFALHSNTPTSLQFAAGAFLNNLLKTTLLNHHIPEMDLKETVTLALDNPVPLSDNRSISAHDPASDSQIICLGWELSYHLIHLLSDNKDYKATYETSLTISKNPKNQSKNHVIKPELKSVFLECLKLLLVISKQAREAANHLHLFLLPQIVKSLKKVQERLSSINIHITVNPMKDKDLKEDALSTIQLMDVATNLMKSRNLVEEISKAIIPLLHPLWNLVGKIPRLHESFLRFILTSTAHHQACLVLTRTSGLPGALLSATRTKRPLLSCIAILVTSQLVALDWSHKSSAIEELCKESFVMSVSILTNCARVQECVYIMNKHDIISVIMQFLEIRVAAEYCTPLLKLLVLLTMHFESQMALFRVRNWLLTILDLKQHGRNSTDALIIVTNMSLNSHIAPSLVASDALIKTLLGHLNCTELTKLSLHIIWALVANSQRGQTVLKQHPVQVLLNHLNEVSDDDQTRELAKKISTILEV